MIQARKVQYMCMSKLSAKELANRAHHFLADGDKKKHQASSQDMSTSQQGLYVILVVPRNFLYSLGGVIYWFDCFVCYVPKAYKKLGNIDLEHCTVKWSLLGVEYSLIWGLFRLAPIISL